MSRVTLFQGDALEYLQRVPSKSIDLVLTDPPYFISRKSGFDRGGAWNNSEDARCRKTPPKTDFGEWDKGELDLYGYFKEFYRVLKKGGTVICFFDVWKMGELKQAAESAGFGQMRLCRWDKSNPVPINCKVNYLSNATEYFLTCVKGSRPTFHSSYDRGIYVYPICGGNERTIHTTQKPLVLIKELVLKHSNPGDTVLDCFAGSGTTGEACLLTDRNCQLVEISGIYTEVIEDRLHIKAQPLDGAEVVLSTTDTENSAVGEPDEAVETKTVAGEELFLAELLNG